MFSESVWKELDLRERQFRIFFGGQPVDCVPAWHFNGSLNQIQPDLLVHRNDRDAWLANQLRAVKANVEEALDSASLFYPIIEMFSLYGTHYMDVLFGGEVQWNGEQFWTRPLDCGVDQLPSPDLDRHPLIRRTLELVRWIKDQTAGRFLITTPDVGCPLNIAVNLFGENFLIEIVANPASAKRALDLIALATRRVYELLLDAVGQQTLRHHNAYYVYTPFDYAGLSICASQLISADHFRDLVADADTQAVPNAYKGLLQHICGRSTQHIPVLARMARVKGLQLNDAGANDFEAYYRGLRPDQVFYLAPTEKMTIQRILDLTGGRRIVLLARLNEKIPCRLFKDSHETHEKLRQRPLARSRKLRIPARRKSQHGRNPGRNAPVHRGRDEPGDRRRLRSL